MPKLFFFITAKLLFLLSVKSNAKTFSFFLAVKGNGKTQLHSTQSLVNLSSNNKALSQIRDKSNRALHPMTTPMGNIVSTEYGFRMVCILPYNFRIYFFYHTFFLPYNFYTILGLPTILENLELFLQKKFCS